MKRILIFSLFLASSWVWARGGVPKETLEKVDAVFAEYDRTNSPGCSLGVIRDGRFIYKRGYGMANLEWGLANSSRTVFRIGSTSKQFTAAAIALLAQQGKLSLDDEIQKFLPGIPRYQKPVTIRDLVHHTSGLRDYLSLASLSGLRGEDYYTDAEVLNLLSRQKEPNFGAGERYLYSNSNYLLLAHIVERASGRNLRQFSQEEILGPLSMYNTHFQNDHKQIVPNRASGYRRLEDGRFEISMTTLDMIGDGGLFTTVEDLLAWDQNFYQDRLGIVPTLLTRGKLENGEEISYAFGLDVGTHRGLKTVRHGGAFVGFRAEMLRFPDQRLTVICLCNLAQTNPSRLATQVAEFFLADHLEPEAEEGEVITAAPAPATEPPDPKLLDDYPGTYEIQSDLLLEIKREGDGLFGEPDGEERRELVPAGRDRFQVPELGATIQFERGEEGSVTGLIVDFGSRRTSAPRVQRPLLQGKDLLPFTGTFFSEELETDYQLFLESERLMLRVGRREPIVVVVRHNNIGGSDLGRLHFERTAEGTVTGFTLQANRVKNLRFVKQ